jgi:hypothetical protein
MGKVLVAVSRAESVTFTTMLNGEPMSVVGVPKMSPAPSVFSPGGSPVMFQVYAPMPPLATIVV